MTIGRSILRRLVYDTDDKEEFEMEVEEDDDIENLNAPSPPVQHLALVLTTQVAQQRTACCSTPAELWSSPPPVLSFLAPVQMPSPGRRVG